METIVELCPKCQGTGNLPQYAHVQNGVCFRCSGTGRDLRAELATAVQKLARARREWQSLNRTSKRARGVHKRHMKEELDLLTREGKQLRKHVDTLQAAIAGRIQLPSPRTNSNHV